jgi:hypothetical protein
VQYPFDYIRPKMMFGGLWELLADLRHIKDAIVVFGPECTISRYRSCDATILLHLTQNDVSEGFVAFR